MDFLMKFYTDPADCRRFDDDIFFVDVKKFSKSMSRKFEI